MKRFCLVALISISAGLVPLDGNCAPGEKLTLSQPSGKGSPTGCRVIVEGHASLEPGEHAWVVAAREDYANLGLVWLQGEASVDPSTQAFSLPVTLGTEEDVGSNFRLSVVIVDEATHSRLRARLVEMMTTNRHLPVAFPTTIGPPQHRVVKKVSNDGC